MDATRNECSGGPNAIRSTARAIESMGSGRWEVVSAMTKSPSRPPTEDRQQRLCQVFESVTGTTTIFERQERSLHRLDVEASESPESIEAYLEECLGANGLEDTIGYPDPE